jgi:hypothetical protein
LGQLHVAFRGGGERHDEVDGVDVVRRDVAEDAGDERAPVVAVREEPVVPGPAHQRDERRGDVLQRPAGSGRLVAETVARQRGRDDVERVGRVRRVRQRLDDVEELRDRTRPAVRQQQRACLRMRRTGVQEVDAHTVDRRLELGNGVEPRFRCPPVVNTGPVLGQVLGVGQGHAL